MERARPLGSEAGDVRGVARAAPRTTPLTMVSGAVAGDDLQSVAGSASAALGRPVAIALPTLWEPVVWPPDAGAPEVLRGLAEYAVALAGANQAGGNEAVPVPRAIADSAPIQLGRDVVGVVVALGDSPLQTDDRPWLEAAAAAVTALMRVDLVESKQALLRALLTGRVADEQMLAAQARRLGFDLDSGAIAICAQRAPGVNGTAPELEGVLVAELGAGRLVGLVPLAGGLVIDLDPAVDALRRAGMEVAVSAPRRELAALHEALREADLLVELAARPEAMLAGQEETYRLLIGVLLRDPDELEQLRERTIAVLATYDAEHDTELLGTLQVFLARHGSTTETAEAMHLHRHTVGYRLARVYDVSRLSPYESDGRERLSLGLKAHQILEAEIRRGHRE
jgi:PucR C-terminal helix-turn-helix domain